MEFTETRIKHSLVQRVRSDEKLCITSFYDSPFFILRRDHMRSDFQCKKTQDYTHVTETPAIVDKTRGTLFLLEELCPEAGVSSAQSRTILL